MYYIYHVPTIKIGCTAQSAKERVREQGYINYEVLEEHIDIYIASDREIALQKQYGLPVDKIPYWKIYQLKVHGKCSKGGLIVGKDNVRLNRGAMNFKARSKAGKKNVESGHIKQLGEKQGKIAGKKNVESGHWNTLISRIATCPYCNITMKGSNYFRWHGDKCKAKPQ